MASPPYSLPPALAERWAAVRWPATFGRRMLMRLALSAPYVAIAVWLHVRGILTENVRLEQFARAFGRSGTSPGAVTRIFPPLAPAAARLLPGGAEALGIVGALAAGCLLHLCWERLVRASVPRWLVAVLLAAAGACPVLWLDAAGNVMGFLAVVLLAVAVAGMVDFLHFNRTTGGYAAGLSLALAVLCDPAALAFAAGVVLAVPLLGWERVRRELGSSLSGTAVVLFPTVAVLGAWAFLEWRFTGAVRHSLLFAPYAFHFRTGVLAGLAAAASRVGWELSCAPVLLVAAICLWRRRPLVAAGLLVVPLDLVLATWLGLHVPTAEGIVLLGVTGLMVVPTRPDRLVSAVLAVEAVAGAACAVALTGAGETGQLLRALGL